VSEERHVSGGVFDHGTYAENGPGTWEALASPRQIPVLQRAGDPSPMDRGTEAVADAGRESEGCIGAVTPGNGGGTRSRPSTGDPCWRALQQGPIANALTLDDRPPGLRTGVERAQCEPAGRFHALTHQIDVPPLARAYRRQRLDAAVGEDGVTQEQYGQNADFPGSLRTTCREGTVSESSEPLVGRLGAPAQRRHRV
jgi:hypothetical protein